MFERFTDRAKQVLVLAQEEARLLNHSFIGTEHILLGLIEEGEGFAAKALESLGISLEAVREKVSETIGPAGSTNTGSPPFTPRAKNVLELALREALPLGHNYIGTEHILMGLAREGEGVAARVLQSLDVDLASVRPMVISLLRISLLSRYEPGVADLPKPVGIPRVATSGVDWPPYPTSVLKGPEERLEADGIELRIIGVLFFEVGIQVMWRLAGIPRPLVDLVQKPALLTFPSSLGESTASGNRGINRPPLLERRDWNPFFTASDDLGTLYVASKGIMQPQANGEWAGTSFFTPNMPEGVGQLSVEWQGQSIHIDF